VGIKHTLTAGGSLAAFVIAVLAALFLQAAGLASPAGAAERLVLDKDGGSIDMNAALTYWQDSGGQASLDKVEAGTGTLPFANITVGTRHLLDNAALWLRFDAVVQNPQLHWKLVLPMSGVDKAALYYRNSLGQWVTQQTGDTLPVSLWPQPGRHPVFSLNHEVGQNTRYYLRIEHARVPYSVMPRIMSDTQLTTARQLDHLLLGVYFGLAALVTLLALINALAYRDWGFASYACYIAAFAGVQAVFTGMAGLYLWPELPELNNIAVFLLPMCTAATALWFVRTVVMPKRFSRALDWFVLALIALLPLIGLFDAAFPTVDSFALCNILVSAAMAVLLMVLGVSLFEGDRHTRWIALGFLPILLATTFPLLRNLGVLASSFLTENALILGSAIEAPILFYGLLDRVTQRREPTARASTLRTTDPLTGLGSAGLLLDKLRQAWSTAERYQQPCALLVMNLSNLAQLQQQHGRETGDRAMVMAAARIRAVAQPTDTVARVGDSLFALLMEGPMSSDSVNLVATKILASGLRPSREIPDADPLLFHIAIGYMAESARRDPGHAQACLERMVRAARKMGDGSRKAIRLIQL
jgi:diguanylate cyclase (GGDEF)-like protein